MRSAGRKLGPGSDNSRLKHGLYRQHCRQCSSAGTQASLHATVVGVQWVVESVLGLGMAISVAPLTTVVMSSVEQYRAGTASGINNAVARVASVLAIAVLGIVMVKLFSFSLNRSLKPGMLPPGILQYVQSSEIKLAGLDLPSGLDVDAKALVRISISHAFVFGFRIVMLICASLSLASAAVAFLMIPAGGGVEARVSATEKRKISSRAAMNGEG